MARIEWVKHRLQNWALWKDRENCGGLGFATQSVLLSEPSGGYRESVIPIDDVDASVTNTAVESLKPARSHLYMTLQHVYILNHGIKETARLMARAESTISANLDAADHALSEWFGNRAELQKKSLST
jgi:hypothetical protein